MASHGLVTTAIAPPREASLLFSSFRLRSNDPFNVDFKRTNTSKTTLNLRLSVKAMGGGAPKFKGTQMKEKQLTEMIEKKVLEAKEVCEGDNTSDECKVAWDEVEEVSQAKADLRFKLEKRDPLEDYCEENPETDECRTYED